MGAEAFARGDFAEAAEMLRRAAKMAPEDAAIATNHGHALLASGEVERALHEYRRAIALGDAPTRAAAWLGAGTALRRLDDSKGAIDALRRAIDLGLDAPESHNALGLALADDGRLEDAERAYRRAIDLDDGVAAVHLNLGNALGDRGKVEEAIAC